MVLLGAIQKNDYINFTSSKSANIKFGKYLIKVQYKRGEVGTLYGEGKEVWYASVTKINNKSLIYGQSYLSYDNDYNPIYDFSLKSVENSILDALKTDSLYVIVENKKGKYIGKKIPKNIEVNFG